MKITTPNKILHKKQQTDHVCVLLPISQSFILFEFKLKYYTFVLPLILSELDSQMIVMSKVSYKSI
jgi:hypothetical protein